MSRQIAIAYAVAGLSVAVAAVTVVGSTVGLLGGDDAPSEALVVPGSGVDAVAARDWSTVDDARASSAAGVDEDPVEIVYVDAPASRGGDDDADSDEDSDSEGRSRRTARFDDGDSDRGSDRRRW